MSTKKQESKSKLTKIIEKEKEDILKSNTKITKIINKTKSNIANSKSNENNFKNTKEYLQLTEEYNQIEAEFNQILENFTIKDCIIKENHTKNEEYYTKISSQISDFYSFSSIDYINTLLDIILNDSSVEVSLKDTKSLILKALYNQSNNSNDHNSSHDYIKEVLILNDYFNIFEINDVRLEVIKEVAYNIKYIKYNESNKNYEKNEYFDILNQIDLFKLNDDESEGRISILNQRLSYTYMNKFSLISKNKYKKTVNSCSNSILDILISSSDDNDNDTFTIKRIQESINLIDLIELEYTKKREEKERNLILKYKNSQKDSIKLGNKEKINGLYSKITYIKPLNKDYQLYLLEVKSYISYVNQLKNDIKTEVLEVISSLKSEILTKKSELITEIKEEIQIYTNKINKLELKILKNRIFSNNFETKSKLTQIQLENDVENINNDHDHDFIKNVYNKEYMIDQKERLRQYNSIKESNINEINHKILKELKEKEEILNEKIKNSLPVIKKRQEKAEISYYEHIKYKETLSKLKNDQENRLNSIYNKNKLDCYDPMRIIQNTELVNIRLFNKEKGISDVDDKEKVFNNVNGYTVIDNMKDKRFKLQTYILENGGNLYGKAAKEIIKEYGYK